MITMTIPYYTLIVTAVLGILCLLYFTNHVFRYYAKFSIYIFVCLVASVIVIPLAIYRGKGPSNTVLLSQICQTAASLIGIKFVIEGSDYFTRDETFIIIANHQSSLDVLGLFHVYPLLRRCIFIMKKEILYYIPFGPCLWLCGNVFIPRSKSEKSKDILNKILSKIEKEKMKLWIFPEGTRSNGNMLEFKKGGFHMALSSQLPILPVVFSSYNFLDHKLKHFDRGEIVIKALPLIHTHEKSIADMDTLISDTRSKMIAALNELNDRIGEKNKEN